MARSGWFPPRRRWATLDGPRASAPPAASPGARPSTPTHATPSTPTHTPASAPPNAPPDAPRSVPPPGRRDTPPQRDSGAAADPPRYPWLDDPYYDPALHRRTPPPTPAQHAAAPGHRPGPTPGPAGPPPRGPQGTAFLPPPGPADPRRARTFARTAARRSRKITEDGVRAFRRAATADGADRSGLTALTYATMFTYAVDAAVAVALANTLFFAAATAESKANVALYLAITVAPFAVVAPVIGPMLDRLERGRRAALAGSFVGRGVLAVVMAFQYDTWLLYPAALGVMVLSKSFVVLKAAVTPRVLPATITLVTTNSRLTTFGLAAGAVFGALAAGVAALFGSPGALVLTAALAVVGAVLCLRIPRWVESTAGEVPATLRSRTRRKVPIGHGVLVALWGNGSIRVLTGFLTLFVAFVVKAATEADPGGQLLLIGLVGAAAGIGAFAGNAVGSRARFGHSDAVLLSCIGVPVLAMAGAALLPGIASAAVVALLAATCSAVAKVCLDAVIQRDLPEASRASAFGRSETVLQLAWVFGGALGVLLPHSTYWIGFTVVASVVALGGVQTALVARGSGLPLISPRVVAPPRPARAS
ncbi:MAG: MFS transporter [Pseudonocardia sp.]